MVHWCVGSFAKRYAVWRYKKPTMTGMGICCEIPAATYDASQTWHQITSSWDQLDLRCLNWTQLAGPWDQCQFWDAPLLRSSAPPGCCQTQTDGFHLDQSIWGSSNSSHVLPGGNSKQPPPKVLDMSHVSSNFGYISRMLRIRASDIPSIQVACFQNKLRATLSPSRMTFRKSNQ